MHKKKICVYGKHGKRTPFAYSEYRRHFIKYFDYVEQPEKAEYLVTGFRQDFIDNIQYIHKLIKVNPTLTRYPMPQRIRIPLALIFFQQA